MSINLDIILYETEKQAAPAGRMNPLSRGIHGALGFAHGVASRGEAQRAAGAALRQVGHAPIEQIEHGAAALAKIHPDAAAAAQKGVWGRFKDRLGAGAEAARGHVQAEQAARDTELLQRHGLTPRPQVTPPRPAPTPQQAAPQRPTPTQPQAAQQVAPAPQQAAQPQSNLGRNLALAGVGYAGYRGMQTANEQATRAQDYTANMRQNLTAPMPSMTVHASYEKFASEKCGADTPPMNIMEGYLYPSMKSVATKSFSDQMASKLISDPIDALHATVKKKFYDEPAWQKNFNETIASDPALAKFHAENPQALTDVFKSVKRFSPTIAKDRLATRNLLRNAMLTGGELDHATMRMLAETEKFTNESRRR